MRSKKIGLKISLVIICMFFIVTSINYSNIVLAKEGVEGVNGYTTISNNVENVVGEDFIIEEDVYVEPFSLEALGTFNTTFYCSCSICCGKYSNTKTPRTSTQVEAAAGVTIAVDPKVIPYGTKVYVEGLGVRIATDCGGAIKGKKMDVYVASHAEALQLGRQQLNVYEIVEN